MKAERGWRDENIYEVEKGSGRAAGNRDIKNVISGSSNNIYITIYNNKCVWMLHIVRTQINIICIPVLYPNLPKKLNTAA